MTKTEALYKFLNCFGLPAYPDTSVPDKAVLPYITYEVKTGSFGSGAVDIGVSIWYKTDSEKIPNAKAEEISKAIGSGGKLLVCEDGALWVKRGNPFCINQNTQDNSVKLRFLNLTIEFLTI